MVAIHPNTLNSCMDSNNYSMAAAKYIRVSTSISTANMW